MVSYGVLWCLMVSNGVLWNLMMSHDICILVHSPSQAFSNPIHPLGTLMNRLEMVYHASYGGIGANKYLLPHAIAETHSLIKRIHTIVRYGEHTMVTIAGRNWTASKMTLRDSFFQ